MNEKTDVPVRIVCEYLGYAMIDDCIAVASAWHEAGNIRDFVERNPGADGPFLVSFRRLALGLFFTRFSIDKPSCIGIGFPP